jgi:hypothetical protein
VARIRIAPCRICDETDCLHISPKLQPTGYQAICGLCLEGENLGITDPDELSLWSLIQRRQREGSSGR